MPQIAGDVHLARQRALRGAGAEGRPGHRPVAVVLALEVGDEDVLLRGRGVTRQREQQEEQQFHSEIPFLLSLSSSTAPRMTRPSTTFCL